MGLATEATEISATRDTEIVGHEDHKDHEVGRNGEAFPSFLVFVTFVIFVAYISPFLFSVLRAQVTLALLVGCSLDRSL